MTIDLVGCSAAMNLVLNFHNVSSVGWFEKIIHVMGKMFTFVDIETIESFIDNNTSLKNACHVTFDDGDMSFYKNAYPILKQKKIPASLFVSPNIVLEGKNYWFQDLNEIVIRLGSQRVKNNISKKMGCSYSSIAEIDVINLFKTMKIADIHETLEFVKNTNKVIIDKKYNISTKQLVELKNEGLITIGAHTVNHPILKNEDNKTAYYEIRESIVNLSDILNSSIKYFAYPNGIRNLDYGERERSILEGLGIRLAFNTCENYFDSGVERFDIPRCGLTKGNTAFVCSKLVTLPIWKYLKNKLKKEASEEIQRLMAKKVLEKKMP